MPDYFFDTTVLIAYFKDEDSYTRKLIEQVIGGSAYAGISAITVAEVVSSTDMGDGQLREKRLALLKLLEVVPIDRALAQYGGELRLKYNLAIPDALIAASCIHAGGLFLSKDPHFDRLLKTSVLKGRIYTN
jgi:predicted nucleic acid-binding protein